MLYRLFLFAFMCCAPVQHALAAACASMTCGSDGCKVAYEDGGATGATEYHIPVLRPAPVPAPLDASEQTALGRESYVDVYNILKDDNPCSRFFGGPARAVEAFNEFARRVKRKALGNRIVAVRMTGKTVIYKNTQTGAEYRLFDEATVNSNGPLFRRILTADMRTPARVGSFLATTRQARALTFLHELGHLVPREGGGWMLPNDGDDLVQSERNTRKVEDNCARQLSTLK